MTPDIRTFVLLVYWGTALGLLFLVFRLARSWAWRATWTVLIVSIFCAYPVKRTYEAHQYKNYKDAALAHFKKRCQENAGERIESVAENVDGIYLAKLRPKASEASLRDQYWMGDPYGYSSYEADYPAETYLYDRSGKTISPVQLTPIKGYKFVEMNNPEFDENNGKAPYLRYTLRKVDVREGDHYERRLIPVSQPISELKSRYAITWEDVSTRGDREFWVAGGKLTILERNSQRVVAERIGYVIDPALGSTAHGRVIWLHVNHIDGAFCPPFESDYDKNKEFVGKVLKAVDGGKNGK